MKEANYKLKIPEFNSKIKFYFSLLFTSVNAFEILTKTFGDDINIFENNEVYFSPEQESYLNEVFENLKWNNEKIELNDKTILRIFNEEEIVNYFNLYSKFNSNFIIDDPEDLEAFYIYMLLEKVKEKKVLEFGNLYDLFDTFLDEEIINAVANLDYDLKKIFIEYFGIKGDKIFEINSDDRIRNEILIKLYSYMLLKREEADIPSIIRNVINKGELEFTFYDYIRMMCNDNTLSNAFIGEMLSKMDYNSQKYIKDVFGEKLDKKVKPSKDKDFKKAIEHLTIIVKVNKEYRKRKDNINSSQKKKKVGIDQTKEDKKPTKEEKVKKNEEAKKEKKPKELKVEKQEQKENKKKETKEKKKQVPKKEVPKKEDKKARLKGFLNDNNLEKKDFEKATQMLDPLSKRVIELYYGIDIDPVELDEISNLLGKPLEDILVVLENAEKKIVDLIKTGEINKTAEKKEKKENKLVNYITENRVGEKSLAVATMVLTSIEKQVVDLFLEPKTIEEIAIILKETKENVSNILDNSADKIIAELELEKEEKKVEEEKSKEKIVDEKETQRKKIKLSSLNEFLKETGLTKEEFFTGFRTLDSFSKNVLSMYLGLFSVAMSKEEIAKKYGRSVNSIENVISSAKNSIVNVNNKKSKIDLNNFLKQNNMTMEDFTNSLKSLSVVRRDLIKAYFGIGVAEASLDALSRKYSRSSMSINKIVEDSLNYIASTKNKKDINVNEDKLSKFLNVNKIPREKFDAVLELLPLSDKKMISMYFGLEGKEMSIPEIAFVLKQQPLVVKENLSNILRQVNTLAKSKNLSSISFDQKYQNMRFKISRAYNTLMMDPNFGIYISSNPMFSNVLSVINGFNDIEKAANFLNISKEELLANMTSISNTCDDYMKNISKKSKNGFQDEDNEMHNEVTRRVA